MESRPRRTIGRRRLGRRRRGASRAPSRGSRGDPGHQVLAGDAVTHVARPMHAAGVRLRPDTCARGGCCFLAGWRSAARRLRHFIAAARWGRQDEDRAKRNFYFFVFNFDGHGAEIRLKMCGSFIQWGSENGNIAMESFTCPALYSLIGSQ